MIDFLNIEKYKENNRIEAKKAMGGLPKSIWETYSAFANALGGVILLGVEEHKDKTLHPVNLPDPEKMIKEFWSIINNPLTGTYRRNGEGDYRCSVDEVMAMQRDAQIKTQDMTVLKEMTLDVLDFDCIKRYRYRMKKLRPGHRW